MLTLTYTKIMRKQPGFSLIEMAIVLFIVALLMGGLLPTISSQIEQKNRSDTIKQLDEIQQALLGFAIIHGRLPCPTPTTIINPTAVGYGEEAGSCSSNPSAEGYLPWKTLGVTEVDAWGSKRSSASDPWTGYWRYRVDRNFASPITLSTSFSADSLTIQNSAGVNITSTTERPIAIIFSTGKNLTADGQNATTSFESTNGIYQSDVPSPTFDDIMIWISRPQLFNRMVAAGKLP
jgi:prepilin-type N-terminal cleavage/methylation domain-containing protein